MKSKKQVGLYKPTRLYIHTRGTCTDTEMEEDMCRDCKRQTETIVDYASGDSICTECGLVMESHIVDERPEWRVFEGDDSTDKIRVGIPGNPLLDHNDLHTHMDKAPPSVLRAEAHASADGSTRSKRLALAFREIRRIAERMNLMPSIQSRACEIFKDAEEIFKGRQKEASYAACLELASQEGHARWSIKSIAHFCDTSVSHIHKAKSRLLKHNLGGKTTTTNKEVAGEAPCNIGSQQASLEEAHLSAELQMEKLLRRFCSSINMDVKAMRAATEITKAVHENLDIRRSRNSIAAACMHIAAALCDPKITLPDVARAADISEETIRKTYKDIYPHLDKVIPAWVANGGC